MGDQLQLDRERGDALAAASQPLCSAAPTSCLRSSRNRLPPRRSCRGDGSVAGHSHTNHWKDSINRRLDASQRAVTSCVQPGVGRVGGRPRRHGRLTLVSSFSQARSCQRLGGAGPGLGNFCLRHEHPSSWCTGWKCVRPPPRGSVREQVARFPVPDRGCSRPYESAVGTGGTARTRVGASAARRWRNTQLVDGRFSTRRPPRTAPRPARWGLASAYARAW